MAHASLKPSKVSLAQRKKTGRPKKIGKYPRWVYPQGSGISITEVPNVTNGQVFGHSYEVIIPSSVTGIQGRREKRKLANKGEAEQYAFDRYTALKKHGAHFSTLPGWAQVEAVQAWQLLEKAKLDNPSTGGGFVRAVETAIRVLRPAGGACKLGLVVAELQASKELRQKQGTLRARTYSDFRSRTGKIVEEFGERLVNTITKEEITAWLARITMEGFGEGPLSMTSVLNYRNKLRDVLCYAQSKRYIEVNPMDSLSHEEVEALGGSKPESADPHILKPSEAEQLLRAALETNEEREMLASVVLRLFCGLRTAEATRMNWEDVKWQDKKPFVHVVKGVSKTKDARNVELPPAAIQWLALCPRKKGMVSPSQDADEACRRFNAVRKAAGLGFEKVPIRTEKAKEEQQKAYSAFKKKWSNITRHSFGSYYLALTDSTEKTTAQMGHGTDEMLFKHYRALANKDDAEKYFGIVPSVPVSAPIAFPNVASA